MEVATPSLKSSVFFQHLTLLLMFGTAGLFGGCRNCDLVEAELRTRDNDLRQMRDEMTRLEAHNDALQRELCALRGFPSSSNHPPELAAQTYSLRSIQLGRPTGGLNDDKDPGDEALQVLVEPRDCDNHVIKAPGSLIIQVLEVSTEGIKKPLSSWRICPDDVRRSWRSSLLSTGYNLVLPWKVYPSQEKLRVVAQFALSDGRLFEAEKDITVHLVPEAYRRRTPVEPENIGLPKDHDTPLPSSSRKSPLTPDSGTQPAALWQTNQSPLLKAVSILPPRPIP
jgi:hypothetical protein